ncbi:hypothetical protein [Xanthomonas medicagonis]|uniref:hypothetical protein n=1 Tax=Xanthomonas medicagonis TaxID=3160841 RepID=UPI003518F1F2
MTFDGKVRIELGVLQAIDHVVLQAADPRSGGSMLTGGKASRGATKPIRARPLTVSIRLPLLLH